MQVNITVTDAGPQPGQDGERSRASALLPAAGGVDAGPAPDWLLQQVSASESTAVSTGPSGAMDAGPADRP